MNFAAPALIVLLLFLPGILLRAAYQRGTWETHPFRAGPIGEELAYGALYAILLHWIWTGLVGLTPYRVAPEQVFALLYGTGPNNVGLEKAFASISSNSRPIFLYFTTICTGAWALGMSLHILVRHFHWDVRLRPFRFTHEWHYVFSGEILDFGKLIGELEFKQHDDTLIAAMVDLDEGSFIYRGRLKRYFFDAEGKLDTIVLEYPERAKFCDIRETEIKGSVRDANHLFQPIEAHYLALPAKNVRNFNLLYVSSQVSATTAPASPGYDSPMSRAAQLAEAVDKAGADAFFARDPVTLGYLTGFAEDGHERFLALAIHRDGRTRLICPALAQTQAQRAGITEIDTYADGQDPAERLIALANDWNLRSGILLVDDETPARQLLLMQATLPAALFRSGGTVLAHLTRQKSTDELALLRRAAQIADSAWEAVRPTLRAGDTETEIAERLRKAMSEGGGRPTFAIVAAGPGSAEPHHENGDRALVPGDVVVLDFGCEFGGYQSDITRTVALAPAPPEAKAAYADVYAAHLAARDALRPGLTGAQADAAARKVLESAGRGAAFIHRTGHGIGRRGHEEPNLSSDNDQPLRPGDCFSIEPGVYYAGQFGIRIENIYTLTERGAESLNAPPAETLLEL